MADKIIKVDPEFEGNSGLSGYVSWRRLEEILRAAGSLRKDETIKGYRVGDAGINFFIKMG